MGDISPEKNFIPKVTVGGKSLLVSSFATTIGSPNSSIWCRSLPEFISTITHGSLEETITPQDALTVADYLVQTKKADKMVDDKGNISWNIHVNESLSSEH